MPVTSSYLQYLPAIFNENPFLGHFLLAFEQILTGAEGFETAAEGPEKSEVKPQKGLEEIIAEIAKLFNPLETGEIIADIAQLADPPEGQTFDANEKEKEFLQWLAGWTALSLRSDWTPKQQRQFLANIVPLYRFRGTKENLVELLKIYTQENVISSGEQDSVTVRVTEPEDTPFQISDILQIGVNTQIGGAVPHYFQVEVKPPTRDVEFLRRQYEIVSALVDLQKPAHTYYDLTILYETIQIGNRHRCVIGKNMILGNLDTFTPSEEENG